MWCAGDGDLMYSPIELYNQIKVLVPNLFNDFRQFGIRYCAGQQRQFGWDWKGASNLSELHVLLSRVIVAVAHTYLYTHDLMNDGLIECISL
jgi:hypothetical protein